MDFLTLIATAGPGAGDHEGWWIFRILWIFLWVGIIATAIWFFSRRRRRWAHFNSTDRAAGVLAERFARGELTNEEYIERLRQLRDAERTIKEDRNS